MSINITNPSIWFPAILSAETVDDLQKVLEQITRALGFDFYLYGAHIPQSFIRPQELILTNYPQSWWDQYIQEGYRRQDPVIAEAGSSIKPIFWRNIIAQSPEFFGEAAGHGLRSGLTVTVRGPHADAALLSVSMDDVRKSVDQLYWDRLPGLQLLLTLVHDAVLRLVGADLFPVAKLTPRQQEILNFVADGKSNDMIADILCVTPETVKKHLKAIAIRFGANNRAHAAVRYLTSNAANPFTMNLHSIGLGG